MTMAPVENPVSLIDKGYDAVFIATGSAKGTKLGVPGEDLDGVYDALEYLCEVNLGEEVEIGEKVAVVGGGNSAIDAARVAIREGAKEVYVIYRRAESDMTAELDEIEDLKDEGKAMSASAEDIEKAKQEGVHLMTLTNPVEIIGKDGKVAAIKCVKMELKEFDTSARKTPYPIEGSEIEIAVDTVIEAIGQRADTEFAAKANLETGRGGTLVVNKVLSTSVPGVFAGGDVTTGPSTVIECIAAGQKAAAAIAMYLQKTDTYERNEGDKVDYPDTLPTDDEVKEKNRVAENKIPAAIRNRSYTEVSLNMSPDEAIAEAARCLRCDIED
jgi:NADH-quinone oxidoreductase subunit F